MKRCPQCNRFEPDDTLAFCRADGTALVTDSGPVSAESGTSKFIAGAISSEIETSILPHSSTAPDIHRSTGPTTVLHTAPSQSTTGKLTKPKSRRSSIVIGIAIALAIPIVVIGYFYFARTPNSTIESIAVLPFENRSGSPDADYLSDGLADSLIYRLSQLPNLKVSPTSSVMRYSGKETDVAQIAKELEVDAVMLGRLVQRGDDLAISVQLIDTRSKKLIWAEQYERKMADLLATQREIATAITEKLQLRLAGEEAKGITKKYTNSNEAYQLYLKGRHHYAKRTRDDFNKAIEYFQRAVDLDPNFALAFALIADLYTSMPAYPYKSPREALPKATAAAKRALEIDPLLPEAHTAMGYSQCFAAKNWSDAERHFRRAIELDPKNSLTHVRLGIYHKILGQSNAALKETEAAVELEPLNFVNQANLTWMYMDAGRLDEAVANGRKIHDLEPGFVLGTYQLGLAFNANKMYTDAIVLAEKELQADAQNQKMLQVAGYAYARLGRHDDARSAIARLKELGKTQYVMTYFVATLHAALGQKDAAFAELEMAEKELDWRMISHIKKDYMLEPLRDDPRFKAMLKRMNLPE